MWPSLSIIICVDLLKTGPTSTSDCFDKETATDKLSDSASISFLLRFFVDLVLDIVVYTPKRKEQVGGRKLRLLSSTRPDRLNPVSGYHIKTRSYKRLTERIRKPNYFQDYSESDFTTIHVNYCRFIDTNTSS